MLYLAKLLTAALATGSLVAAYSSSHHTDFTETNVSGTNVTGNNVSETRATRYQPYGCKVTINGRPGMLYSNHHPKISKRMPHIKLDRPFVSNRLALVE